MIERENNKESYIMSQRERERDKKRLRVRDLEGD